LTAGAAASLRRSSPIMRLSAASMAQMIAPSFAFMADASRDLALFSRYPMLVLRNKERKSLSDRA